MQKHKWIILMILGFMILGTINVGFAAICGTFPNLYICDDDEEEEEDTYIYNYYYHHYDYKYKARYNYKYLAHSIYDSRHDEIENVYSQTQSYDSYFGSLNVPGITQDVGEIMAFLYSAVQDTSLWTNQYQVDQIARDVLTDATATNDRHYEEISYWASLLPDTMKNAWYWWLNAERNRMHTEWLGLPGGNIELPDPQQVALNVPGSVAPTTSDTIKPDRDAAFKCIFEQKGVYGTYTAGTDTFHVNADLKTSGGYCERMM